MVGANVPLHCQTTHQNHVEILDTNPFVIVLRDGATDRNLAKFFVNKTASVTDLSNGRRGTTRIGRSLWLWRCWTKRSVVDLQHTT